MARLKYGGRHGWTINAHTVDLDLELARTLRSTLTPHERAAMAGEDWSFRCGFLLGKFGACHPVDKLYDAAYAWRLFGSEADAKRTD